APPRASRPVAILLFAASFVLAPSAVIHAAPGPDPAQANWAVTLEAASLYSGPTDEADVLAQTPAMTLLQVLRYNGDWAYVANPRTHETAYVPSDVLGPTDPPSRYLVMTPPKPLEEFEARGVVTDSAQLAVFPTSSEEAVDKSLDPNTWLTLTATVN